MDTRDKQPRTTVGARFNRLTHGLRSATIVIPGLESQSEWERFADGITRSLAPETPIESALAARIAEVIWRMRRIARAEQEFVVASHRRDEAIELRRALAANPAAGDAEHAGKPVGGFYAAALAAAAAVPTPKPVPILPDDADLDKLIRYEAHLGRQLYHALHELEAIQERRRGNPVPLARVNVHGLPGT